MESNDLTTIKISEDYFHVLDQTLIPHETRFIQINDTKEAWEAIREMKVRGGPLIAVVALQGLRVEILKKKFVDMSELNEYLLKSSDYLKTSRPTAVNLGNDLNELLLYVEKFNEVEEKVKNINSFILKNFRDYENSSLKLAKNGADIILNHPKNISKKKISILTICNTGKLAMPGVGTALGIIREINNRGMLEHLYIPETRPYNQGSRLTAYEAIKDNLPGILISDSMVASLLSNNKVDCVIVGADRVTKLGFTANKIGTYTLAVIAEKHKVPFYVAATISTIDKNMNYGNEIIIEERPGDELRKLNGIYLTPKEINVWNPSFDVTPPNLIEAIITEEGNYEFDKNVVQWEHYTPDKIEKYLKKIKLINEEEKVECTYIGDGNMNYVYKVKSDNHIYCVKQALPWVKCVGTSWPISLDRIVFETEALKYAESLVPELVPKFIHFNKDIYLFVMEYLENHNILRNELVNGNIINQIGEKVADFTAKTCYFQSTLSVIPDEFRNRMKFWNDNTLCTLTEQVIFSDPYIDAPLNRHTSPYLDNISKEFQNDIELICEVHKLRHKFITLKQTLIHGDLHAGSVFVNQNGSLKIIDGEFSYYGPIGFDTGTYIASLIMSYFSKGYNKNEQNIKFQNWILNEIKIYWNVFVQKFLESWDKKQNRVPIEFGNKFENHPQIFKKVQNTYIHDLFIDTLGFTGVEIIRRIFGVAHISDFESIENLQERSIPEFKSLKFARKLIVDTKNIKSIEEMIDISKEFNSNIQSIN